MYKLLIFTIIILYVLSFILSDLNFRDDEGFTMALVHHSFSSIVKFDSYDVHPPLYYLILKIFLSVFTFWTKSIFIKIIFSRFLSLISLMIGFLFLIKILNLINMKTNIFFLLVGIFLIPSVMMFSTQIRMYSLGFMFCVISFYELISFIQLGSVRKFILSLIFISLSSYTHYFAGLFAGLLVIILSVFELYKKHLKVGIRIFSLDVLLLILYLPWFLYTLPNIIGTNKSTFNSHILKKILIQIVKCAFSFSGILNSSLNSNLNLSMKLLLLTIMSLFMISCFLWSFKNLPNKFNNILVINLIVLLLILLIGSLVDVLLGFEFSIRFVYPSFMVNSFLVLYILSRMYKQNKNRCFILLIPILLICIFNSAMNINNNETNFRYSCSIINQYENWAKYPSKDIYVKYTKATKESPLYENSFMSHNGFYNTDKATLLYYMNKKMYVKRNLNFPISNGRQLGHKIWPNIQSKS